MSDALNEMEARQEAAAARAADLPKTAADYAATLPADFVLPPGVDFDVADHGGVIDAARSMAHAKGWTQKDFSDALAVFAAAKAAESGTINAARTAEQTKLGANGLARIEGVLAWLDGEGLGVLKSTLTSAAQVEAFERHITRVSSQGASAPRAPRTDDGRIPDFANLSFEQRRLEQDRLLLRRSH